MAAKAPTKSTGKPLATTAGGRLQPKGLEPKWEKKDYKPPRKVSDEELQRAKKIFFDLDRDGSGSIDSNELAFMLRALGQNPTEDELKELINKFDDGDKDGQMQLREFLMLYTYGLDSSNSAREEDVADAYRAVEGAPDDPKSMVNKIKFSEFMVNNYDLEVDMDAIFGVNGPDLNYEDFKRLLAPKTDS